MSHYDLEICKKCGTRFSPLVSSRNENTCITCRLKEEENKQVPKKGS